MAVEIHTDSPINRNQSSEQPEGSGNAPPKTAAPQSATSNAPAPATAHTTTTGAPQSSQYTSAYPAAAPPAPTSSVASAYTPQYNPTTTSPSLPSQTTSSPPPPQPGAVPSPYASRSSSPRQAIPPPPKAGEKLQPASYYASQPAPTASTAPPQPNSMPQRMPLQMSIPPPADPRPAGQPIGSTTSPTGAQGSQYLSPTQPYLPTNASADPMRRGSAEHPSGYVQNPYATDMTSDQRFGQQRQGNYSPSLGYNNNDGGNTGGGIMGNLGFGRGGSGRNSPAPGILTGDGKGNDETYWDTVGGWVKGAGKKLGEAEAKVWEMVDGKK